MNPKLRRIIDAMPASASIDVKGLSLEQALQKLRQPAPPPAQTPALDIEDVAIDAADYRVPVRIYRPPNEPTGLFVYLHGGGWVIGSYEHDDYQCRQLAVKAGCIIVSVNYRLAPEFPFPTPLDDCVAATRWASLNAPKLGVSQRKIAIGGTSAGANLAAACALKLRDEGGADLRQQSLFYPIADGRFDTPSYEAFATGYYVSREMMEWFWDRYAPPERRSDPLVSPLRAPSLSGLPPALVIVAELDPLRDEGERYAERLRDAGVPVNLKQFKGMVHGFLKLGPDEEWAREAIALCASELRRAFSDP